MKAVLMSIQPKWCELIANGKKTIEVRKTNRCKISIFAAKECRRNYRYRFFYLINRCSLP